MITEKGLSLATERYRFIKTLGGFDLDERLAWTIAENSTFRRIKAGEPLMVPGIRNLYLVVNGQVEIRKGGELLKVVGSGMPVGSFDFLAIDTSDMTAAFKEDGEALVVDASLVVEIAESDFGVMRSGFKRGATMVLEQTAKDPLFLGPLPDAWLNSEPPTFVDRLLRIKDLPMFQEVNIAALADLVRNLNVQTGGKGEVLALPGRTPDGFNRLEKGRLLCVHRSGEKVIEPGQLWGMLEILAERPYAYTLEALEPYIISETPRRDFLNTLELHLDFARSMHRALLEVNLTGKISLS